MNRKSKNRSELQRGASEVGAEGLKGASKDMDEESESMGREFKNGLLGLYLTGRRFKNNLFGRYGTGREFKTASLVNMEEVGGIIIHTYMVLGDKTDMVLGDETGMVLILTYSSIMGFKVSTLTLALALWAGLHSMPCGGLVMKSAGGLADSVMCCGR